MAVKFGGRSGREFSEKTKKDLSERVAYMCSNPYCRKLTIKPKANGQVAVKSGKACHIISASPRGPRADNTKSDEFIRSFKNAIWLCDICSREVDDNQSIYDKEQLLKWKREAETYVETLATQDTRLRQLRILTQNHLSALRILSGLPTKLDQTYEQPNGNGINMTRLFMELELVLFDNQFFEEANLIRAIMDDLDKNVCPFVHNNKTGRAVDVTNWKNGAVKLMMRNVMQFKKEAYDRYLEQDTSMVTLELDRLKGLGIVPESLKLTGTSIQNHL
jgi:hypothetical protein